MKLSRTNLRLFPIIQLYCSWLYIHMWGKNTACLSNICCVKKQDYSVWPRQWNMWKKYIRIIIRNSYSIWGTDLQLSTHGCQLWTKVDCVAKSNMLEINRLVKCGRKLPGKCRTMIRKVKVEVRKWRDEIWSSSNRNWSNRSILDVM